MQTTNYTITTPAELMMAGRVAWRRDTINRPVSVAVFNPKGRKE